MKLDLLNDILAGLEELERQEQERLQSDDDHLPGEDRPNQLTGGKLINVVRELPKIKRGPAGEPISTVDNLDEPYDYDPRDIHFFTIEFDSPEHAAKLKDFHRIAQCDPTTADKIVTLA